MSAPSDAARALEARARRVQDTIGWTDYTDPEAMAEGIVDLARLVRELCTHVRVLTEGSTDAAS